LLISVNRVGFSEKGSYLAAFFIYSNFLIESGHDLKGAEHFYSSIH